MLEARDRRDATRFGLVWEANEIERDKAVNSDFVARGILLYGSSPCAVTDFEQAVTLGSPVVWPYLFLARHYLITNRFEQCRSMCERGT